VVVAALAAILAAQAGAAKRVISVPATTPFMNSGIALQAGERATISATGTISYGSQNAACAGSGITPEGCSAEQICPVAGGCGALVGRLGSGAAFVVGDRRTVKGPGELWLGINDQAGDFGDNSGAFSVTIVTSGSPTQVAKVLSVSGKLYVRRSGTGHVQALHAGEAIYLGDELLTSPTGRSAIEFVIGGRVSVGPGADVTVTGERSVDGGKREDTSLNFGGATSPAHVEIQTNGGVLGGIKG
jgi:PA-IL-like protein